MYPTMTHHAHRQNISVLGSELDENKIFLCFICCVFFCLPLPEAELQLDDFSSASTFLFTTFFLLLYCWWVPRLLHFVFVWGECDFFSSWRRTSVWCQKHCVLHQRACLINIIDLLVFVLKLQFLERLDEMPSKKSSSVKMFLWIG